MAYIVAEGNLIHGTGHTADEAIIDAANALSAKDTVDTTRIHDGYEVLKASDDLFRDIRTMGSDLMWARMGVDGVEMAVSVRERDMGELI